MKLTLKEFDELRPLLKDDVKIEITAGENKEDSAVMFLGIMNTLRERLNEISNSLIPECSKPIINDGIKILENKAMYLNISKSSFRVSENKTITDAFTTAYQLTESQDLKKVYEQFVSYFK